MSAYLDNSATTKPCEECVSAVVNMLTDNFGNASSLHDLGIKAMKEIILARGAVADSLGVDKDEIIFTSGATEANNMVLFGSARAKGRLGKRIVTTAIEHESVLQSAQQLEKQGFEVIYLEPDSRGNITEKQLFDAVNKDTILVSMMYINNEVGTIEPIYQIGKIAREKQILFHTDAVQAYAQIPLSVNYYPVDLLSASAHKFHGPKGVGFLYIRDGIDIPSFIHGGSQERGKRAGTENVAGIVGMAKAAEIAYGNMRKRVQKEIMLRNYLIERVMHEIPDAKLNGHRSIRLPGNVNFSFKGLEGASLLILLDEDGICASGGSACNTGEERISYVIKALGVPEEYAPGTIRITLCGDTTRADVDAALVSLKRNIAVLRG